MVKITSCKITWYIRCVIRLSNRRFAYTYSILPFSAFIRIETLDKVSYAQRWDKVVFALLSANSSTRGINIVDSKMITLHGSLEAFWSCWDQLPIAAAFNLTFNKANLFWDTSRRRESRQRSEFRARSGFSHWGVHDLGVFVFDTSSYTVTALSL